jgi:hypothetical protein
LSKRVHERLSAKDTRAFRSSKDRLRKTLLQMIWNSSAELISQRTCLSKFLLESRDRSNSDPCHMFLKVSGLEKLLTENHILSDIDDGRSASVRYCVSIFLEVEFLVALSKRSTMDVRSLTITTNLSLLNNSAKCKAHCRCQSSSANILPCRTSIDTFW